MRIAILLGYERNEPNFRLCEPNGTISDCWLPGIENPDPDGALDRGGFRSVCDAKAFALGIDRERAGAGLLPGVTVDDIDRERGKLDSAGHLTALHANFGGGPARLLPAASMLAGRRRSSRQPRAKITADDVRAIRADTRTQLRIAADFGIEQITVSRIKRRETWRQVV